MSYSATILISLLLNATGPSSLHSEIIPVSVNDNQEVLCKTRFYMNRMGGYGPLDVEYGFCIITRDDFKEYRGITVKRDDVLYYDRIKYWGAIFQSSTT